MRVLVLSSGLIGHEINTLGVAEALGFPYQQHRVSPRWLYARLAPWGPVDPQDPFPDADIVITSGRVTVPYARALKRRGAFVVFLQDPRWARKEMDLIWVPEHDRLRGANVMTTLTSPHPFSPQRLSAVKLTPDSRLATLTKPRCAVMLGGSSRAQHFTPSDLDALAQAVHKIRAQGFSLMITPSRRTPPEMRERMRECVGDSFFWDGTGANPYLTMLALADAILVTGDSANMVGEAVVTGVPVYVFEPSGGRAGKLTQTIDALIAQGAVRRWSGHVETFAYDPIFSSAEIATEILRRIYVRGTCEQV